VAAATVAPAAAAGAARVTPRRPFEEDDDLEVRYPEQFPEDWPEEAPDELEDPNFSWADYDDFLDDEGVEIEIAIDYEEVT